MSSKFREAYEAVNKKIPKADAFGQPVYLLFEGSPIYRSHIGALLTFLVTVTVVGVLIYELFTLFQRAKFNDSQEIDYFQEPPRFNYKDENVIYAFGYVDEAAGINRSHAVLNVKMFYSVITRHPNGTVVEVDKPVSLQPCTLLTFMNDAINDRKLIEGQYKRSLLDNFMCASDLDYEAYGDSHSSVHAFLQIQVSACVNGTDALTTCATPEFISDYFATKSQLPFRLYLMNSAFNVQSYEKPMAYFIDEIKWFLSPETMNIHSDISLRKTTVNTMDDYLGLGNGKNITAMSFEQDRRDRYFNSRVPAPWLTVTLMPSNYVIVVYRSYATLGTAFGVVGGTLSILMHVFGMIGRYINKRRYLAALAEKMITKLNMLHHYKKEDVVELKKGSRSPDKSRSKTLVSSYFQTSFKKLIRDTKRGFCFFKSAETKLIWKKAMSHVRQEIEVFNLLHRLREMEMTTTQLTKSKEKGSSSFFIESSPPDKKSLEDENIMATLKLPPASLSQIPLNVTDRSDGQHSHLNLEMTGRIDTLEEKYNINIHTAPDE
jgi:hypothetical protein